MTLQIDGVVPVIPVPFEEDGSVAESGLRRAVDFVVQRGVAAMCLPAYGSEFYKLTEAERESVIAIAIDQSKRRIPVIAQANHPSAHVAADLAKRYERMGADAISFALPRQFGSTEQDLLNYCGQVSDSVSCPILIQDFNPGGPTVSPDFIATASGRHANISYFKLEEPMIIDKLVQIRDKVGDSVGILGGWGGYYMLESIPFGLCGIMPGVPICDLLDRVYRARQAGDDERAYDLFGSILPYIAFSLQDFELFLQVEKRLMVRRGLFKSDRCRPLLRTLSDSVSNYVDGLIDQIIRVIDRENLSITL